MSHAVPKTTALDRAWLAGLAVGLPLLAMLLLGNDSNWDLRNYHLYNPHAWLTGRDAIDIAPAQLQSWHNPLLDVPMYLLFAAGANPRWAGAWLSLPCMACIWCLLRMQPLLAPASPTRLAQCVLALLALGGAATWSTLATSMNDAFVGAAMLGSLLLVLSQERPQAPTRCWLFAGLLAGAMAGLKLTASLYCLALAFAALPGGSWRERLARIGLLAAGGALGFLLSYGYWGWHLSETRGNPLFPYFNQLFHSADALPQSYSDARFRAQSPLDLVLAPFRLLANSQRFSEPGMKDPRLLLGLAAFPLLWWRVRRELAADSPLLARMRLLLVFFFAAYFLWICGYGIYRYAIVLELLACLALVSALAWLPRAAPVALVLALLLVSADTKRPKWGRDAGPAPMAGIRKPAIPSDSMVLLAGDAPLAYLALGLPERVPMVAVANNFMDPRRCTPLQLRAQDEIRAHAGPLWLLVDAEGRGRASELLRRHYGLAVDATCTDFVNSLAPASLCPLRRSAIPAASGQCGPRSP